MTKIEKLFEAICEACPELNLEWIGREKHYTIYLEHLLMTAGEEGIFMNVINLPQCRIVFRITEENNLKTEKEINYDLTKSLSDQSPETLEKIAEVICG